MLLEQHLFRSPVERNRHIRSKSVFQPARNIPEACGVVFGSLPHGSLAVRHLASYITSVVGVAVTLPQPGSVLVHLSLAPVLFNQGFGALDSQATPDPTGV